MWEIAGVWVVIAIFAAAIVHGVRKALRKNECSLADLLEAWRERPTPPPLRRTPEEKAFWLVAWVVIAICALVYL